MKKKILFVCLGNICRSSTAEGVMLHLIREAGLEDQFMIDSAGILAYHQGELPDSRMREKAPSPAEWEKIHRMTEYCTRIPADHVPDPYYGGAEGFEYVLDILEDACAGLLTSLTQDS